MYGIPSDFDPAVFVGHDLARVCFGAFTVHLEFAGDEELQLTVVGSFKHAGPPEEGWNDSVTVPASESRLMRLTNHAVIEAVADRERLVLTFDHGHSLTVIDDDDHYEAFQIRVGEKLWVV